MKISQRDRNLLIILLAIVIAAAYYFLAYQPAQERITEAENQMVSLEIEKQMMDMRIRTGQGLADQIEKMHAEVEDVAKIYYTELSEEEVLMEIHYLASDLDMDIRQISFNPVFTDDKITYHATLQLESTYSSLVGFLHNVRRHERSVLARNINLRGLEEDRITGNLVLEFNAMPVAEDYTTEYRKWVHSRANTRDLAQGPFIPFEGYQQEPEEVEIPIIGFVPDEDKIDEGPRQPRVLVNNFDAGNYFFVGNLPEIDGWIERSPTRLSGRYSADMTFDFGHPRMHSEANLVFEHQPILLNRQVEFIGLSVYAFEASNHNIGMIIVDQSGREHDIRLTSGVDWTQWKDLEVTMPSEIAYPCEIVRIYVEGVGFEQKGSGRYLFDQIKVAYPVDER